MAIVGYARVSTTDQNLDIQLNALKSVKCDKIFSEKKSGTKQKGRTELESCLDYLREGDTLYVTRIDRLSRSLRDLQNLVHLLNENGIFLKTIEQPIDTSSAAGKAFFDMLGYLRNLKPTYAGSVKWKVCLRQKRKENTKGVNLLH